MSWYTACTLPQKSTAQKLCRIVTHHIHTSHCPAVTNCHATFSFTFFFLLVCFRLLRYTRMTKWKLHFRNVWERPEGLQGGHRPQGYQGTCMNAYMNPENTKDNHSKCNHCNEIIKWALFTALTDQREGEWPSLESVSVWRKPDRAEFCDFRLILHYVTKRCTTFLIATDHKAQILMGIQCFNVSLWKGWEKNPMLCFHVVLA